MMRIVILRFALEGLVYSIVYIRVILCYHCMLLLWLISLMLIKIRTYVIDDNTISENSFGSFSDCMMMKMIPAWLVHPSPSVASPSTTHNRLKNSALAPFITPSRAEP